MEHSSPSYCRSSPCSATPFTLTVNTTTSISRWSPVQATPPSRHPHRLVILVLGEKGAGWILLCASMLPIACYAKAHRELISCPCLLRTRARRHYQAHRLTSLQAWYPRLRRFRPFLLPGRFAFSPLPVNAGATISSLFIAMAEQQGTLKPSLPSRGSMARSRTSASSWSRLILSASRLPLWEVASSLNVPCIL